jgi:schlafen family protein
MIELFRVPWSRVDLPDVRAFLDEAQDDEGVTWEAKADDDDARKRPEGEEPGRLHARTLHKAVSALANQLGGYLLLGARWDKTERRWLLPGFVSPEPEAKTWLVNVLRNLRPVPRFDPRTWHLDGDRWVAVIQVDPVDEPPCMTPLGHVYERVSGRSVRVTDPALLDQLIRRGRGRRDAAQVFAERAANVAMERPEWRSTWSVKLAVAMAPVGRETDNISSRLFVPSFGTALIAALHRFAPDGERDTVTEQSSLSATSVSSRGRDWSRCVLSAHWNGAVVASAAFSVGEVPAGSIAFDEFVAPACRAVVPLVARLGGYGPAHLTLVARRAPKPTDGMIDGRFVAAEQQPQPPSGFFGKLPEGNGTVIGRWVSVDEPSGDVLASIRRELERAAGRASFEPEAPAAAQPSGG